MPALSEATDSDLLATAGSEPEAFGELFRRYSRSVYAYCARRTGNLDLAEDLNQRSPGRWERLVEATITDSLDPLPQPVP